MGVVPVVLNLVGVYPLPANICGKVLAGGFAFVAHRAFTFRLAREHRDVGQAARYFLLLALNLPISTVALGLVLRTGLSETLAKIVADVLVLALTYWLSKRFVFLAPSRANKPEATR
jgi:putative flippase GtrA